MAVANLTTSNFSMEISVKELLQLEKVNANHELNIYYIASGLPKGGMPRLAPVLIQKNKEAGHIERLWPASSI